jgi:hypothetical protein
VLIYGESGIGKSTLASEWADGRMFFFDAGGELNDLEVFKSGMDGQAPITDWTTFREYAASYVQAMSVDEDDRPFGGCVLDTADVLSMYCAQHVRHQLGVAHQSDAEWGKGWDLLKETWLTALAKLAATPGGVLLISHAKTKEIKKRRLKYDKTVPTLTGGIFEVTANMADLVLFVEWDNTEEGGEERRTIYTKPSRDFEAKERGQSPRLPAEIEWPLGESGYQVLRRAWYGE